jgi:hypothetical protein
MKLAYIKSGYKSSSEKEWAALGMNAIYTFLKLTFYFKNMERSIFLEEVSVNFP